MTYGESMPDLVLDKSISKFLESQCTLSLATVDAEGAPHAANVQFVSDDQWNLYWVSKSEAAHSRHLVARPQSAVTVYAAVDGPAEIHGLQMHGIAEALNTELAESLALPRYSTKFPFTTDPPFRDAVAAQTFYRFRPTWARWIDNRRGFGWSTEVTF